MTEFERNRYLDAYYENEADANRQMSFANAFGAILILAIWVCYLTGFFFASPQIMPLINIAFPISGAVLLSPLLYVFKYKKLLKKPGYKFFVVFSFIIIVAVLNVLLPRNSYIGWALCIIMTNHYYNPKLGKYTFAIILTLMLLCLYFSMFLGEYDANVLGVKEVVDGDPTEIFGVKERYEFLHEQLANGQNRYLQVFIYTFLPRALLATIIFAVSNSLNIRTKKLLIEEIHVNSEQQKTKTELDVAKDIQLATLPTEFVTSKDIEIQAELKAAKQVGGDFYDYFVLDENHIGLLIADVSGKGIPAAMFMMKTITCFRNVVSLNKTPAEILKEVNRIINKGNDSNMFVTCFFAIINTKTGEMNFANAGHNPPIVGQKKKFKFLTCKPGFVLGPMKEAFVSDETYKLKNGDIITLYTDGITEARNDKNEFYGEQRLLTQYNKKDYSCLVELHHSLKDDIEKFVNGEDQADDMTYITLKYHGDNYLYKEEIFKGVKENISKMLDFINEFANEMKIEQGFVNNLCVVADEMLSNIVKYGYADFVDNIFIRLLFNVDRNEFVMTIIDRAEEFDPFSVDNKPLEGDIKKRKEGGLGILIVKKLMSEYAYDYINHKNIVTLKKKF